jgi:outer membrane protein
MKSALLKALLVAAFIVPTAHAQELKIGYVNSDLVLRDAVPAKTALAKLQTEFSKREKELADMGNRLKVSGEKFDKEQAGLVESDKIRRQRELVEQDREFQRKRREFQEDLSQRRNEELASVVERANKVIKQLAEQEKFDLIVQEVIFASARIDITDKVIRSLNSQTSAVGAK